MKKIYILTLLSFINYFGATSQNVLTQWNFENSNNIPSKGIGTLTVYPSTLTQNYVTGYLDKGTALNTSEYNKVYDSTKLTGLSFDVSTSGKTGIKVYWCERHSNTASRFIKLQYSIDGNIFKNFMMNSTNISIINTGSPSYWIADFIGNVIKDTIAGVSGSSGWSIICADLSGVNGVENNPLFKFRVCPVPAPGDTIFTPTNSAYNYGTTGTIRFDSITIAYGTLVPLTISGFTLLNAKDSTIISWTSLDELNVSKYELEGSIDGINFCYIKTINPEHNNTSLYNINTFTPKGLSCYRLKIIDNWGSNYYGTIICINNTLSNTGLSIYPNPATSEINISYDVVSYGASLTIYNTNGQIIANYPLIKSSVQTTIDTHALPSGHYILTITNCNKKQSAILIIK